MSISNVKKVYSEMTMLESESDYCIPFNKYYILNLTLEPSTKNNIKELKQNKTKCIKKINLEDLAKKMLSRNMNHQPLSVYIFKNNISLIFSCLEENQNHYKNGSHHKIISEYVSVLSLELKSLINGSIVELDTRTSVIMYLIWKVHSNSLRCIVDKSEGTISINDTKIQTLGELKIRLNIVDVIWDDIDLTNRYGIFFKLKKKKNTIIIDSLSEFLDSRDIKKYTNFIFY
jgi:hypothetical protein